MANCSCWRKVELSVIWLAGLRDRLTAGRVAVGEERKDEEEEEEAEEEGPER